MFACLAIELLLFTFPFTRVSALLKVGFTKPKCLCRSCIAEYNSSYNRTASNTCEEYYHILSLNCSNITKDLEYRGLKSHLDGSNLAC